MKIPFFGKRDTSTPPVQTTTPETSIEPTQPLKDKAQPVSQRQSAKAEQSIFHRGLVSALDYIAPAAFTVTPQFVQLENLYARSMFVFSYARYLNTNWLSRVVNLDVQIDISMFIYPLDSNEVMSGLRRKVTQLGATESIDQEKGMVRDPQLETAIRDIEELRDALAQGTDRLFQFGLYFTLYAKTTDELNTLTKQLEALLGGLLIYTKQSLMQQEQGFNSGIPLCNDELVVTRNLDTASLSTSFPFVSSDLSSNSGILYGVNLHNSSLVLFDRFTLENANSIVFATSGAGKSFTVKLEALRSLMWGTDIIAIDPENEFERLAEAVGGTYLRLSLNSPERINPFDLPQVTPQKGEDAQQVGQDVLRTAVVSIKNLVGIMVGGLTPEEDAVLDKAVYETYALKDITADPQTHGNEPPLMGDLQNVLVNMTGAENLVRRLSKFTEGTFAGLFNQRTNIDLSTGMVVFSIRDLEEQLRPIGMFLVLSFIWNKARYQMKKRLVLVDEAWILMKYKDSSDFLFSLVKRARKYFMGVTLISQDVEDFITSSQGRAIVNNSAMRILLKQSPAAVDKLAEIFKLTESEKLILREAKVGQGIFFAGGNHVAMEVIASYEEEQLITTNPAELLEMKRAEAERAEADLPTQNPTDPVPPLVGAPPESVPQPNTPETAPVTQAVPNSPADTPFGAPVVPATATPLPETSTASQEPASTVEQPWQTPDPTAPPAPPAADTPPPAPQQ